MLRALAMGLGRFPAGFRRLTGLLVAVLAIRMAIGQPAADQQTGRERIDTAFAAARHPAPAIQARTVLAVLARRAESRRQGAGMRQRLPLDLALVFFAAQE